MLDTLRKSTGGWAAKILLGLLVLSFALWGIADVFRGFGSNTVATVGGETVTPDQFQSMFTRELNAMSQQFRQRLTPEQGRRLGLDQQVFSKLLIDAHARDLGLGVSDGEIAKRIQRTPAFRGISGNFDADVFRETLLQNGLTEQGFVELERQQVRREQALAPLSAGGAVPETLIAAFDRFQNETRVIEYFVIPADKAAAPPEPDDVALKGFFDANAADYRAPEYRRIGVLTVAPEDFKAAMTVGDDEARAYFAKNGKSFGTPEKRRVQQITFADKAAADAASAKLKNGVDFLEVAKSAGRTEADIDRGLVEREKLLDPALAEAAFKLAKDTASEPITGALATSIVRVTEIVPEVKKSFDEVKTEIVGRLQTQKAAEKIQKEIYDQVEELRGTGTPVKDIAAKLGLKVIEVPAVDRTGMGKDGKPVADLPSPADVLKRAFDSEVGVESDAVEVARGSYAFVDVLEIMPARDKTFEEVKAEVKTGYLAAERQKSLAKIGREAAERIDKGEGIATVADSFGTSMKTTAAVKREESGEELPPTLLQLAFSQAKGSAGSVTGADGSSRVVFRVKDVIAPKPLDDTARKTIKAQLASAMAADAAEEYVAALRTTYGLDINQANFDRLFGAGGQQQ